MTAEDVERLLRKVGQMSAGNAVPRPDCLSDEQFVAFCDGKLTGRELRKVVAHLGICEACLLDVSLCLEKIEGQRAEKTIPEALSSAQVAHPSTECIPFSGIYGYVLNRTSLTERQQQHLTSCPQCVRLYNTIRRVVQEQRAPQGQVYDTIATLVREFVEQSYSHLAPYVDMAQAVAKGLVSGPAAGEPERWKIGRRASVEGALAIAGLPDPQQQALLVSVLTIAAVVVKAQATVAADPEKVTALARQFARKFGAGRELTADLARFLSSRLGTPDQKA